MDLDIYFLANNKLEVVSYILLPIIYYENYRNIDDLNFKILKILFFNNLQTVQLSLF